MPTLTPELQKWVYFSRQASWFCSKLNSNAVISGSMTVTFTSLQKRPFSYTDLGGGICGCLNHQFCSSNNHKYVPLHCSVGLTLFTIIVQCICSFSCTVLHFWVSTCKGSAQKNTLTLVKPLLSCRPHIIEINSVSNKYANYSILQYVVIPY